MILRQFLMGSAVGASLLVASQLGASAATVRAIKMISTLPSAQSIDFSVHLPLQKSAQLDQLIRLQADRNSPLYHHFLTVAQFRDSYAPSTASIRAVEAALVAKGLSITGVESQLIHVRGRASTINAAFSTQLGVARSTTGGLQVAAATPLAMPAALAQANAVVLGLATTIKPRPEFARANVGGAPLNRYSKLGGYWFDDLKQAYDHPSDLVADGKGVTVATVGVSDFSSSDAALYFTHEKFGTAGFPAAPVPQHVLLGGQAPFDPNNGASDEADLDVQQVAGAAPGATVLGVSLNSPGEAFLTAYSYLDESNRADIVSTSYGECELYYTAAYNNGVDQTLILQSYHDLFRQGNAQGITFIFSSGDDSGLGCLPTGYFGAPTKQVFHPIPGSGIWVDDPNVTAVGGTNLVTSYTKGSLNSTYVSENATGDRIVTPMDPFGTGNLESLGLWGSGSGVSVVFPKPAFQSGINTGSTTARVMPDVSMHMGGCPFYGPSIQVNCDLVNRDSYDIAAIGGTLAGLIGTSASAPEFAGLLAVKESVQHSRLGNENEDLYSLAAVNTALPYHFFRQGIVGYNGVYHTSSGVLGYSPILGVGTPIAQNFALLPFAAAAGIPQSLSNP